MDILVDIENKASQMYEKLHIFVSNEFHILDEGLSIISNWLEEHSTKKTLEVEYLSAYVFINSRLTEAIFSVKFLLERGLLRSSYPILRQVVELTLTFNYLLSNPYNCRSWFRGKRYSPREMIELTDNPYFWKKIYKYLSNFTHANMISGDEFIDILSATESEIVTAPKTFFDEDENIFSTVAIISWIIQYLIIAIQPQNLPLDAATLKYIKKVNAKVKKWIEED